MSTLEFEQFGTGRRSAKPAAPRRVLPVSSPAADTCDVAIIGAGPYGLSLAAHLKERGVAFRIFGKPLETWRAHMPADMMLKSDGIASSLSHPSPHSTLKVYCARRNTPYADHDLPVSLDLFLEYAQWFVQSHVPLVEGKNVIALDKSGDLFTLDLDDGERVLARNVVLAVGIGWFANRPKTLDDLAPDATSHSYDHRDVSRFKGRDVVVIGAGASAIDLAAMLHKAGASVRILARNTAIRFHNPPERTRKSLAARIKRPSSTIGPGWRSAILVRFPNLFRYLPQSLRLEIVRKHLGPAPGWFMRERVEGKVETFLGCNLEGARMMGGRVLLQISHGRGTKTLECDHVVAATGYRSDLSRLSFVAQGLSSQVETIGGAPLLSAHFETSVRGLYVVGPAAAPSFGPLMRFMTGAQFVAPRLSRYLMRRINRGAF